jgi:hypothetical protein
MFQVSKDEYNTISRSQIVTLKLQDVDSEINQRSQIATFNNIKYLPHAFTEQGIAMLSGILNSEKAIDTNITIMRAFVAIRQYALNYAELSTRLDDYMKTNDTNISEIFDILEELTAQKKLYENRKPIGFK